MSTPEYDARDVISKYMATLNKPSNCLIRDASELPYPKDLIRSVLQHCIKTVGGGETRNLLRNAYVSLGNFQEMTDEEREAVAILSKVGAPGALGSKLYRDQARRITHVAKPLQAVMDRLKAELAVLAQELKLLPGSS